MMYSPSLNLWYTKRTERAYTLLDCAIGRARVLLEKWAEITAQGVGESRAAASDIDIPCPSGLEFRPFQKAAIAYASKRTAVLIADDPGLGKTIEAIGLLNTLPRTEAFPVLIVCPASLTLNWKREFGKWSTHTAKVAIASSKAGVDYTADVCILSYDMLARLSSDLQGRK